MGSDFLIDKLLTLASKPISDYLNKSS